MCRIVHEKRTNFLQNGIDNELTIMYPNSAAGRKAAAADGAVTVQQDPQSN